MSDIFTGLGRGVVPRPRAGRAERGGVMRKPYVRRSPELVEAIRALAAEGATASAIARAIGVSLGSVILWAAQGHITLLRHITLLTRSQARRKALADPEVRARMRKRAKGVVIPAWVPVTLHEDYLDVADEQGEEAAAAHVRRLKREAA